MKNLLWTALTVACLTAGCRESQDSGKLTAAKAAAERIAKLEQKADLLERVVVSLEKKTLQLRKSARMTGPGTTNLVADPEVKARQKEHEQVMINLAADVAELEASEQSLDQRLRSITEAIVALEQAVLLLDGEVRQLRFQDTAGLAP